MILSEKQKLAITTVDKNLQIIACAGSGKTGTISARIASILKEKHESVKPENIVAFTYTEKAAAELKSRINKEIRKVSGEVIGLSELYVGTIHGFCYKLLQDYIPDYQKYDVLDEIKTKIFIDKNYKEIGMTLLDMRQYVDTKHFMTLMSLLRENQLNETQPLPAKYSEALAAYNAVFAKYCYFDFTMIMEKAILHLENNQSLRDKLAKRIKFLTVDEYQDVNSIQEKLISVFYRLGANICVVGDDDQTIYQWRGSDVRNILAFADRYKNVETVILDDNYRSTEAIVDVASKVISKNNPNRFEKKIVHKSEYRYEINDIVYNEFGSAQEESNFIANRIVDLQKSGFKLSDMAILVRVHSLSASLVEALDAAEIDYIVEGVNELFETPEAKAASGIFQFLQGQLDRGSLEQLWHNIRWKNLKKTALANALQQLEILKSILPRRQFYDELILQSVFHDFVSSADLKESEEGHDSRLEIILYNLGKFSQVIQDFETIYFRTSPKNKLYHFNSFLKYVAENYYPEGHLQNPYMKPDAVRIYTIHQSKGLQFPVVFVPGLVKNKFPMQKIGGKQVWHFIDKSYIHNQERFEGGNPEDERRLFYVAITRAKKFLFLTNATYNVRAKERSRFLTESLESHYLTQYNAATNYAKASNMKSESPDEHEILLNFSILSDYYKCPYLFKLTYFYGFCNPLGVRMGYGKSLHNMVMEMHQQYLDGSLKSDELQQIVDRHFHLPYGTEPARNEAKDRAEKSINQYYDRNAPDFENIEYIEKDIEIDFGNGVRVNGRIDLVKKNDGGSERVGIIDFKTAVDPTNLTDQQLKIYAIGYEKLTGTNADYLEIYNLDKNEHESRNALVKSELSETGELIKSAADKIRDGNLPKSCAVGKCATCFMNQICLSSSKQKEFKIKVPHA